MNGGREATTSRSFISVSFSFVLFGVAEPKKCTLKVFCGILLERDFAARGGVKFFRPLRSRRYISVRALWWGGQFSEMDNFYLIFFGFGQPQSGQRANT